MSALRVVSVAVGLVALFVGCGSTEPVNISTSGTISASDETHPADGSHYDEYTFSVKSGWTIDVTMHSTEVDSFLQLRRSGADDNSYLEEADDISGSNLDAHLTVVAPASGTYKIWANTAGSSETGAYTLTIIAEPPK